MNNPPNPQKQSGVKAIAIVVVILIGVVALSFLFGQHPMSNRNSWPSQFQSNGEQIYFSGSSNSGIAINARGGDRHMSMMSGNGACVACHGANRQGGRLMPRFWITAPPLTFKTLFNEHNEDGHDDHEGYSDESLRRAITQGIDPGGKPLDLAMPRWSISEKDLDDLIAFLKTGTD